MPRPTDNETPSDSPPDEPPADEDPTEARIVWVLVVMVFLAVFVWPEAFGRSVPSGTVAALLTAITTIFVAKRAQS